ncbi:Glyoxalase family protein [Serinicoccus hydrothermalis]|uniref:Glyoxalase family protein n=2 Tax=Serinicoccus hydrothermalis TaxID=1758689 RepID=A0A1B1NDR0_9MICO|nr:Glyoxalase family protein [Serinicoccus hydrothermalis]
MHQVIFVNLPVQDLERSRTFFTDVGYTFNTDFCDDSALCLELGPTVHAMLLDRDFFATFHDSPVAEPGTVEALLCLSASSREQVDGVVDRAVAAGGTDLRRVDHGMMYGRTYADLDGHVWEVMWMDRDAATRESV